MKGKFPTEWISWSVLKPGILRLVVVYTTDGGVQMGYSSLARRGSSWRSEYICVRKSRNPNAAIIDNITHWCYAPTVD